MKPDRSGLGDLRVDDARRVVVVAYDGDDYLGGAYTSNVDGTFEIEATRVPTADTWLFVFPMYFNQDGMPQFAVAIPSTLTYKDLRSDSYYYFAAPTDGKTDVGTITVRASEGSGAIRIHQFILYAIQQAELLAPTVKPFNVLALWKPGEKFDCGPGTCYVPRGWGAVVEYDDGWEDLYQGAVLLAGTEDTPHEWSKSVILHELGHYMMDAYSLSPREAATHYISKPEPPGMAWSEGWASFFGQSMLQTPIYYTLQQGSNSWFDVEHPASYVPRPDPDGPMDQQIGELMVTTMLWHLWDGKGTGEEAWDQVELGQQPIWDAFVSERLTNTSYNRGYSTVDFVDMLDALRCGGVSSSDVLSVTSHHDFPYDDKPTCAE